MIDEMQSNGKADAVVAFSPDRSREGLRSVFINLLATRSRFATTGTASFDEMSMDAKPAPVRET